MRDEDPFGYAWQRLHDLAEKSGAKLIATVGNHDVDSRYKSNAFDPRGYAPQVLTPQSCAMFFVGNRRNVF
jgi:hypothetical protein